MSAKPNGPIWPDKDLVYEFNGEHGEGRLWFYYSQYNGEDAATFPLPKEPYPHFQPNYQYIINMCGCGINFQINRYAKSKEEGIKEIKNLISGRFKSVNIHPYLGLITFDVENWEQQK